MALSTVLEVLALLCGHVWAAIRKPCKSSAYPKMYIVGGESKKSGCSHPLAAARQYQLCPLRTFASGSPETFAAIAISHSVRQGERHTKLLGSLLQTHPVHVGSICI